MPTHEDLYDDDRDLEKSDETWDAINRAYRDYSQGKTRSEEDHDSMFVVAYALIGLLLLAVGVAAWLILT